jgi:hypothetical protein
VSDDWEDYNQILSDLIWTYGPLSLDKKERVIGGLIDVSLKNIT